LPQSSGYFDAVVVSKLLMHVEDWQTACRELVRVLRPGACIFQLNDAASFEQPVHRYFAQRQGGLGLAPRGINGRAFPPRSVRDHCGSAAGSRGRLVSAPASMGAVRSQAN
jgi:ubiquinone/menaquinone biosynthesis C-methylase UbiE